MAPAIRINCPGFKSRDMRRERKGGGKGGREGGGGEISTPEIVGPAPAFWNRSKKHIFGARICHRRARPDGGRQTRAARSGLPSVIGGPGPGVRS